MSPEERPASVRRALVTLLRCAVSRRTPSTPRRPIGASLREARTRCRSGRGSVGARPTAPRSKVTSARCLHACAPGDMGAIGHAACPRPPARGRRIVRRRTRKMADMTRRPHHPLRAAERPDAGLQRDGPGVRPQRVQPRDRRGARSLRRDLSPRQRRADRAGRARPAGVRRDHAVHGAGGDRAREPAEDRARIRATSSSSTTRTSAART